MKMRVFRAAGVDVTRGYVPGAWYWRIDGFSAESPMSAPYGTAGEAVEGAADWRDSYEAVADRQDSYLFDRTV